MDPARDLCAICSQEVGLYYWVVTLDNHILCRHCGNEYLKVRKHLEQEAVIAVDHPHCAEAKIAEAIVRRLNNGPIKKPKLLIRIDADSAKSLL